MSKVNDFLQQAGFFYLATTDGMQPKIRPIGAHFERDGKVFFGIGSHKNVYRQMQANPLVEIVAFDKGKWLRYTGKAVFADEPEIAETFLNQFPNLREVYNEQTGNRMMIFYLENPTAMLMDAAGNGTEITE